MQTQPEKESKVAEYLLKSFEEKSPFDYDILDSMYSSSEMMVLNSSDNKSRKI